MTFEVAIIAVFANRGSKSQGMLLWSDDLSPINLMVLVWNPIQRLFDLRGHLHTFFHFGARLTMLD